MLMAVLMFCAKILAIAPHQLKHSLENTLAASAIYKPQMQGDREKISACIAWHGRPACSSEAVTKSTQHRRQSYLLRLHRSAVKTNSFILKSPRFRHRLPQMCSIHIVLNSPHQIYN